MSPIPNVNKPVTKNAALKQTGHFKKIEKN